MAADRSTTSVSFLHGADHKLVADSDQTIMTLEHASGWKYGDHFFFDSYQPFADGTTIYGEWHPRLSAGKLLQRNLRLGPIKDVRICLYGVGVDLDLPRFAFFTLNLLIRDDKTIDDETTIQISPSWSLPFALGNAHFDFTGFVDIAGLDSEESFAQWMVKWVF